MEAGRGIPPATGLAGRRAFSRAQRGRSGDFEFEFGGTTGFSDFFEQLFGARSRAGGAPFGRRGGGMAAEDFAERGGDAEGDIMVTLEEAVRGSVRAVSLRRAVPCDNCGGTGIKGTHACPVCGGSGQVTKTETYQVKIPAGVTQGQRLRVPGRGEAGSHGGVAGDLYLRVHLAKHPDFFGGRSQPRP